MKCRMQVVQGARAQSAIRMALAKSFVFNARRANRVCSSSTGILERVPRRAFLGATDPLIAVRDANEQGSDPNSSPKPSMHEHEGDVLG
jgi:hypothetical protein